MKLWALLLTIPYSMVHLECDGIEAHLNQVKTLLSVKEVVALKTLTRQEGSDAMAEQVPVRKKEPIRK